MSGEDVQPSDEPLSLVRLLEQRAAESPERRAFLFLRDGEEEAEGLTYAALYQRARAIAVQLAEEVERGDRALLLYPPGPEFVSALFGCLCAGVIAVPAPPPDPNRLQRTLPRVDSILRDADPKVILTPSTQSENSIRHEVSAVAPGQPHWLATEEVDLALAERWHGSGGDDGDLAYLQFTSGSTSAPRGVMASHRNILHNCHVMQTHWGYSPESVAVMWVPNFHDDGLVHGALLPIYTGHRCVLMPPVSVVQQPSRWLRAISRYRATHSGGPNFIYRLTTRKVVPEQCRDLDLSTWGMAYNAAEPILHETLVSFHRAFAQYGFRRESFFPSYGLAETTLLLSTGQPGREPALCQVDAAALERNRVVEVSEEGSGFRTLVGSGRPVSDTTVRIVDPASRRCTAPGEIGEIWVSNPSVGQGYWQQPVATEETFGAILADRPEEGRFLRTGDLGFLASEEIFVTGRLKDMILIRGRNFYPQDIELTVEEGHPLIRPGGTAAFSVSGLGKFGSPAESEELLVIVAEVECGDQEPVGESVGEAVMGALRQRVLERHGLAPGAVVLLKPGGLLKTSSGKIRRQACRQLFLDRSWQVVTEWREAYGMDEGGMADSGLSKGASGLTQETLQAAAPQQRRELLVSYLGDLLAGVLSLPDGSSAADQPLSRYGIDSLRDVELIHRLEEDLGLHLPTTSFLRGDRLGDLAGRLAKDFKIRPARRISTIGRQDPRQGDPRQGRAFPLSFAQERLWFLHRLVPHHPFYNVPFFLRLCGPLDPSLLSAALAAIEQRHETLRTTFAEQGGRPVQIIHTFSAAPELRLPQVDLRALGPLHRKEALRLAQQEARRPFDLEKGPLSRAILLVLGAAEHLLLFNSHHIVTDGWSLGILLGELRSHYQGLMANRSFTAAALPIQYVDFVLWQRETLSTENLAPHLAYWRQQLADAPVVELPTDRPRPAVQVFRGENLAVRFPAGLSDALQAVGRGRGATPAMTLLAGFFALLSRHSGQERIVVGSPMANRGVREVEGLIGLFVNSLPLLGDVSGGSVSVSFRRLLGRVRDMALDAYRHQDLPFEKLVEDLKPERDLSRNPFFQVLFALQRFPVKGSWGGGLTVEPLIGHSEDEGFEGGFQPTRLDLELHLWNGAGDLAGFCSFDRALFDSTTIQRLMGHFIILLGDMAENPDADIAELPLLTSGERHQLLVEWNGTGVSFENSALLHEVFQAQAECYPEALAVVGEGEMLSYGALEVRSNRLAWFLRVSWEEPRCGLFIERSLEMMIGLLGILKAGGAYVPLEVSHPAQRLSSLLGDAGLPDGRMKVLLTHSGVAERLPEHDLPQVLLDRDWGQINRSPQMPPVVWQARPDQLAYVIYTSGSTGRPKGVMNTHRGVLNRLLWMQQQYRLRRTDRVLQKTPLSFDVSVWELFWPLMNGAPLVLARPEGHRDSSYLTRLIERERVNVLHFVPSMLAAFLKDLEGRSSKIGPIELVIASGEALSSDLARRFREQAWVARAQLHNLYGPTEAAIDVSHFHCDGGGHDAVVQGAVVHDAVVHDAVVQGAVMLSAGVSIGRPVANTRLYLFGRAFRTVPLGVAGELYLAGVQVARGYLGRPGLTAERFVPAPFPDTHRPDPGGRMYRTGDLARFLADGNVEFLGRLDHQVKIRGYRIELGEIEAVLSQHPGVRAVCVVTCAFHRGEQRLVACVVGTETSSRVLREVLRTKVPEYMVPPTFLHLETLPLLPNGKIDRRTLVSRALEAIEAPASAASPTKAPHTPVEQILAGIWRDVLCGEETCIGPRLIGAGDDFFALGGHSLLATQVISRIRKHFGLELTVRELFEVPTLAALGRHLEAARRSRDGIEGVAAGQMAPPPPLKPRLDAGPPPLSFGQQRLWFLDRLVPNSSFYNLGGSLRLRGALDCAALEGALGEVVRRHESLRTTVASVDGAPVQVIHPWSPLSDGSARGPGGFGLRQVDLSSLPIAVREVEARRLAREDGEQPFDLAAGPLFRSLLLCLERSEHELFLTQHHLISDGWSFGVLEGEVAVIYGALRSRQPSPLPDVLIQYADFTVWQRQWLPKVLAARLAWWKEQVGEDPPLLELPTDYPRPAIQRFRGAVLPVRLGMGLSSSLQALGRQRGVTLAMTLLAGFYTLLYRITGQEKILVGSPFAGRTQWETEGMIGLLVNNLALVGDLSVPRGGERCDFCEVLGRVREMTLGAQAFQDLPLERLVEELHLERDLSRNPLFQVIFAYQNVPLEEPKFDGLEVQRRGFEARSTRFDVELHLGDTVDGLAGLCTYDRDLFDATTIQRMVGHYRFLLKTIVQSPRAALGDLGWFSTAEKHQLVVEWSGATTNREEDHSLGALFEKQAEQTPHAVALVMGGKDEQVSYGELDRRADHLAHSLHHLGVGSTPETPVGICLERSLELIMALLGVLKAGGFYVPLDPGSPLARLQWMVRDVGLSILLSRHGLVPELAEGLQRIDLDASEETLETAEGRPLRQASAQSLAYVIYTSGSTGRPKGVAVPHRGVIRLVRSTNFMSFGMEETFLQLAPISFDASTLEIWGPLLHGGRLVIFPPGLPALAEVAEVLERHRITSLWLTAGLFHQMADEEPASLCRVPQLVVGGDVLSPLHVQRLLQQLPPPHRLINGYGPTENTTFTTCHRMSSGEEIHHRVPIGRPIHRTRVAVVDHHGRSVPVGVRGELLTGGDGLARGYHHRPGLSAEKFVPDPRSPRPGGRVYRTGDLVRFLADGTLEFLGRFDHQVKIRGFRIELGEVEVALEEHSAVRKALVVPRQDCLGDLQLVAYLTREKADGPMVEAATLTSALHDGLQRRLPAYMMPSSFVVVDQFPLGSSGKVDRGALPAPPENALPLSTRATSHTSHTPVEEIVAAIWSEVLALETIGLGDDFFACGGHSLLAIRALSRVRERLQVELPVRDLFEAPTVRRFSRRVEEALGFGERVKAPGLKRRAWASARRPLSFAQQRLWLVDRLLPGSIAYNLPLALRLVGALDVVALHKALQVIVSRHETLRATFRMEGGEPIQVVLQDSLPPLPTIDLRALPGPARGLEVQRRARQEGGRSFNLSTGPLFRTTLLFLQEAPTDLRGEGTAAEHVLLLTQHHIVSDAWSLDLLQQELVALYTAFRGGGRSPLSQLPIRYADFAMWQREWLGTSQGGVLSDQLGWWKERLGETPPVLRLPTDRRRPEVQGLRGGCWQSRLPPALHSTLRALSLEGGATLTMTLLAGFFILLSRTASQPGILVGSPIANRRVREVEALIGFFVNTLTLQADLSSGATFCEFLGQVRETCLGAYSHQDLPFEKLVEALGLARDLSRNPLFQVMFSLQMPLTTPEGTRQHAQAVHWQLPELEIRSLDLEIQSTHFDLEMHLWEETDGSLGVACVYDRDLFDPTTIGRMVGRYGCLLEEICAAPEKSLREFPWLTTAERHQALVEWGEGAVQGSVCSVQHGQTVPCIVEAFLRRAQEAPAAIALVCSAPGKSKTSHQVLSYGTLHRQARCLSHRLRALGVGPQAVVAVLTGRTAEMIIAYLAVLEAGGAYLPLDPDTPVERLQWMLHDSTARVLLTSPSLADRIVIGAGSPENSGIHRIVVGRESNGVASGRPSVGLLRHASPLRDDDLAYVIYTSGSTGRPKGVMVSHRGLRNLVSWHLQQYQVCPEDRATLLAAVIFDASVWEIWPVLAAGACLHIPPPEKRLVTADLVMWMVEQSITLSFLPTPLAQELVATPPPAGFKLRLLLTGGDVLHPLPQPIPFALINHYGPTENSVVATSARVFSGGATAPPIGRPIAGVRAVVLDGDSQPAAVGVAGELWLGGRSLARGYLNLPGRTAESFVPDPLSNGVGHRSARDEGAAGGRFYRTGDQVRFLADGRLEFLGRLDHQVKVRGMRMELGEIEGALGDSSAVREAVVVLVNREGVSRLVGWVVAVAEDPPGEDLVPRLLATLRRSLPQAMVPSNLVVVEALPRTASGKVDRLLLARKAEDIAADRPQLATSFEPPRGDLQQKIAGVWQEVIALERIGIHDNFFEVGGHSLAMVKIRERLREIVEQELSLVEMFQYPTIHLLARYLSEGMPHSRAGEGGGVDSSRARAERQGEKRHTARARLGSRLARRRRAPKGPRK